jgi:hypothetical protein
MFIIYVCKAKNTTRRTSRLNVKYNKENLNLKYNQENHKVATSKEDRKHNI